MNQISTKQNEDEILSALVAQKFLYSKSKVIKGIYYVLMIFVIGVGLYWNDCENIKFIVAVIMSLLEITKNYYISYLVDYAATIQQYIDLKLFGFKVKKNKIGKYTVDDIKLKINEINVLHKKYSEIQKANNGESKIKGVRDWYTGIDSNLELNAAILRCQKQNTFWDQKLVNWYKKIKIVEAVILIFILHVLFKKNYIAIIIESIAIFIDMGLAVKQYINLEINVNIIKVLEDKIGNIARKTELEEMQKCIFERRKSTFMVPNWLHKITSSKIHSILKGG